MPDLEIISEKPFSLVDMKEKLAEIKKRDKDTNVKNVDPDLCGQVICQEETSLAM